MASSLSSTCDLLVLDPGRRSRRRPPPLRRSGSGRSLDGTSSVYDQRGWPRPERFGNRRPLRCSLPNTYGRRRVRRNKGLGGGGDRCYRPGRFQTRSRGQQPHRLTRRRAEDGGDPGRCLPAALIRVVCDADMRNNQKMNEPPSERLYPVSCIVCGRREQASGRVAPYAWATLADEQGWRIMRPPSGEFYELRCPEHREAKPDEDAREAKKGGLPL